MEKASDALFALKPVTFRYKKEIDPAGTSQLGLYPRMSKRLIPTWWCATRKANPTACAMTR